MLELPISLHFKLELSCTTHEFLNEHRAGTLCSPNSQFEERFRKFEATGIKLDQFGATLLIRQCAQVKPDTADRLRYATSSDLRLTCAKYLPNKTVAPSDYQDHQSQDNESKIMIPRTVRHRNQCK